MTAVLITIAFAALMVAVEFSVPGRHWPRVDGWWPRALLLNGFQVAAVFVVGVTWDRWFPQLHLWDATSLGTPGGALVGYVAITFVYYWWHRARHALPFLWRWFHR